MNQVLRIRVLGAFAGLLCGAVGCGGYDSSGNGAALMLAPDARVGSHLVDGSRVVGEVMQRSPVQGAIPWLLMRAKSNEGAGALAGVKYIQRVDTIGGVAPATGCDAAHADAEARVDYSANYDFYGAR